jgi:hypothetical protein
MVPSVGDYGFWGPELPGEDEDGQHKTPKFGGKSQFHLSKVRQSAVRDQSHGRLTAGESEEGIGASKGGEN